MKRKPKIYLLDLFLNLKGNPRVCIWLEPLWGIPYNLYVPYVSLYMVQMGLTPYQIGIVAGVYYFSMAISALMSGVLTDKLGRRRTTVIFDVLSWSVPTFLWMCATNIYWFIAAALFNGMWRITDNSWGLLLVEDAEKDKIVSMYSLTSVMGLVAAFVAPLSALAVRRYGVTPTMRALYGFTCVSMTTKFLTLYHFSTETSIGKKRMELTKDKSILSQLWGCKDVFIGIIKEKRMLLTLGIMSAFSLVNTLQTNYFALFMTQRLGIAESNMATFTMISSLIRLIFLFVFAKWISSAHFKRPLVTAWGLFILGQIILLMNPGGAWAMPLALAETAVEALALSILYPMTSSLLFVNVEADERARINGLIFAAQALITAVFPVIIGYFTDMSLSVPFYATIGIYILAIWMTFAIAKLPVPDQGE